MTPLRAWLSSVVVVIVVATAAAPAHAQFFRNNSLGPQVGWLGLGTTFDPLLGPAWNIHDNPTLGVDWKLALPLDGLRLDNQLALGGSSVRISDVANIEPIFSLSWSIGIRYDFLVERLRPFVSAHVQYLQIIPFTAAPAIATNSLLGNKPFWVGPRLGGGVEYIFADEMSIALEVGATAFLGLNTPPPGGAQSFILPAALARLSYNIYF